MFAYLDAGTGSLIVAALAGGIAGIAVLFRLYWNRFLGLFSKSRREKAKAISEDLVPQNPDELQ
jgi:hypothetical protein